MSSVLVIVFLDIEKMKRYYNIFLFVGLVALLWSCHTTEENYKASYDKAVEASRTGERGEIYRQELEKKMKNTDVVDGDSIRMLRRGFNIVEEEKGKGTASAMKYNVVVAEFVQLFNAKSYCQRLRQEGRLEPFVVYLPRQELYCVVAKTTNDLSVAATFANNYEKYMKLKAYVPKVWIIERI